MQDIQWESSSTPSSFEQWSHELPPVIQRWMESRNFKSYDEFQEFVNFGLKSLKNPSLLKDLDKAVDRLVEALKNNEKICLYADFDMDGTPGVALLIKGLQYCGFDKILSFQPNRFDHGYGVHPEIIEDFINHHEVSLFVTVDVGITDIKAVKVAKDLGVDFIITDHHQQKEDVPEAYAIVNPNQKDCESGLNHLCGTGVAFYLILGLRRKLNELGLLEKNFDPKKLLDCFAIGTLTDMVPLVQENRPLIQHGLLQLARTERVGIKLLMEKLNLLGKGLGSSDVSIQLAPKLNALGRMNSSVQALDLFLVDDYKEAENLVEETLVAQKQRTETQKQAELLVEETIQAEGAITGFVFQWSEEYYKGIVGLLATRVTNNYGVPCFVGSIIGDKIVGSARAPKNINLLEAFDFAKEHLNKFGGHHQAAGFELDLSQAEAFKTKLQEFYKDKEVAEQRLKYDFTAELSELKRDFKYWLKKLEPYGVGFPIPLIRMDHLFVASVRVLKEKHLKFVLNDMNGNKIDALWFFADNIDEKRQITSKRVSVVVEPSINSYMGKETLQVFIRDLKIEY